MAPKIPDVVLPDTRSALFVMRDTEAIETPAILATALTAPSASSRWKAMCAWLPGSGPSNGADGYLRMLDAFDRRSQFSADARSVASRSCSRHTASTRKQRASMAARRAHDKFSRLRRLRQTCLLSGWQPTGGSARDRLRAGCGGGHAFPMPGGVLSNLFLRQSPPF